MSDELGEQPLVLRLPAVIEAKDEQLAVLQAQVEALPSRVEASAERERRLELRVAELERRLSMDSSDSGTPSPKECIGAKAACRARQESQRKRRKDRKRGGQPGHQGKGPERDPDPDEGKTADPPIECRSCHRSLNGAGPVEPGGRRSSTSRSSGKSPSVCSRAWTAPVAGRSRSRPATGAAMRAVFRTWFEPAREDLSRVFGARR